MNGIDCGLFAVMNSLHTFDGVAINPLIFTQEHITRVCKVVPSCSVMRRMQQDSIYAVYFPDFKLLLLKIYHWMSS